MCGYGLLENLIINVIERYRIDPVCIEQLPVILSQDSLNFCSQSAAVRQPVVQVPNEHNESAFYKDQG